jgi:hypothetical protein
MSENTLRSALLAWSSAKDGIPSVVGNAELDAPSEHFAEDDGDEARIYFAHSSTIPNPRQHGTRDTFLLRLSEKGQELLREMQPDTPSTF